MITQILAGSLLSLLSFGIGVKYQERKNKKEKTNARIAEIEGFVDKLKEDRDRSNQANFHKEMLEAFLKDNIEYILKQDNPEEAMKEWLAEIERKNANGNE